MRTLASACIAAAFAIASTVCVAQSAPGSDVAALRDAAKSAASKRSLVESTLELTPAEAKKFWPAYDAVQRKLDANNRRYHRAIEDLVAVGTDKPLTDAYAKQVAGELVAVQEADARALRSAHNTVLKAVPGRKALRYLQLENRLHAVVRADTAIATPLVR